MIPNNTTNNCYGVRNALPKKYLERLGHEVKVSNSFEVYLHKQYGRVLDPGLIDWAEVVVFCRHYDVDEKTIENMMDYAKQEGKLVVYETDDLLNKLDPANPMYETLLTHQNQFKMMVSKADVCTTTGAEIKKELQKYNKNVVILPNCIDTEVWKQRKGGNQKLRIGWAGGSSHMADMQLIIDVVKQLKKEYDFEFVIFGLANMPWRDHIDHIVKSHQKNLMEHPNAKRAGWYDETLKLDEMIGDLQFEHHPFVPHTLYNHTLSSLNLDIGLCPLVDTVFNRCKSAIKFYEYAMVGTACLASKIPPYEGEVGYYAKNKYSDWYTKLKRLIEDRQFLEQLQKEQYDWVLANRNIAKLAPQWASVYNGSTND